MATDKKQALARVNNLLSTLSGEQQQTIAKYGLKVEEYRKAVIEAVIANPGFLKCSSVSIAKAMRSCCRDGLIPDGRQAAIFPMYAKGGGLNAFYMPMKEGLCKMIYRATGGIIKSGVIREGDEYRVIERSDDESVIEVFKKFGVDGKSRPIIAAWASIELPDGKGKYTQVFDQERIAAAKKMSRVKDEKDSVWLKHEEAMAEKAVLKSLMNKVRFLLPDQLKEDLENDEEYPSFTKQPEGEVIDMEAEAEPTVELVEPEPAPEPEPEPEPEPKKKKADVEDDGTDLDF